MRRLWAMILVWSFLGVGSICQSDSTSHADATPEKVVKEYCNLDLNGARVGGKLRVARIFKLVTWKDEPGWDTITVVRTYRVIDSHETGALAEVRVEYETVGQISVDSLELKTGSETVTFALRKTGTVWKIDKPVFQPHVSIEGAIAEERQALAVADDPTEKKQVESNIKQLEVLKKK